MLETIIALLKTLSPLGILLVTFAITFIENIFPPSPSDILLVFCGTLVGVSVVGFVPMLFSATAGSVAGFLVMYWIGYEFGVKILESGKLRFLPLDAVHKAEAWFQRYGFGLIVANRFLSGTRAVISFFAGMSQLPLTKTTLLSAVSAFAWNAILIVVGMELGENWIQIQSYLESYGAVMSVIAGLAILIWATIWFLNKKKNRIT